MIRRPPRSTQSRSSAASDVYKRQGHDRRRAGPDPRRDRCAGRRGRPRGALPGHGAPLGSGCRHRHGGGRRRAGGDDRVPDRPRARCDGPPQRLEGGVRVPGRSTPASRRRGDRGRWPGPVPDPPRARPRGVLPGDARDGRGLRRGEHGACTRPGRGRPAGAVAEGGARAAQEPCARGRAHVTRGSARARDLAVLGGLLVIAALLRLPGLTGRGTWDADQGNDMATLQAFVTHGVVPLLGPPTSIGNVHHGALYYYLLAPAAIPAGGTDPTAVVLLIALAGIAAVAVTWWLGRAMGGPVAGLVAGLLAATSAAAVGGSTFIWNPNLLPLAAALALAFGWRAWVTGNARWWLAAGAAQAVVQQCHILGIIALPALAGLWLADLRRSPGRRRPIARWGLAGAALIALGYLPLLLHELGSGFDQTRAALDYLRAGGDASGPALVLRLFFVPLRVVALPRPRCGGGTRRAAAWPWSAWRPSSRGTWGRSPRP